MRFDGPSAEVATARRLDWVHFVEVGRTGRERGVRPQPIRMCIGCRQRGVKTDLLRVVLVREAATQWLLPDLSGSAPGRGAHLHPTTDCFALAERRRAFARALRVEGMLDVSPLRRYVEHGPEQGAWTNRAAPSRTVRTDEPEVGSPTDRPADERGSSGS